MLAAAGTCGEAAWQAWLEADVDLLGEAPLEEGRDRRPRGRKAAIPWLAPSARMNLSRSSMLVLPLARHGSFFTKNSSRAIHPPPTRTITVLRRIRTSRSCWESPN